VEVVDATVRVDELPRAGVEIRRPPRDRVDREVATAEVLGERADEAHGVGPASIGVPGLGSVRGDLDQRRAGERDGPEAVLPPRPREERVDDLGRSGGGEVPVGVGRAAEEPVADAAADEDGVVPCVDERPQRRPGLVGERVDDVDGAVGQAGCAAGSPRNR
jgi:hypothetical protein